MADWQVILTDRAQAELRALPADMRARFLRIAEMIEMFGPEHVGMPHVRPLGDKLFEMRMTGRAGIARAIYFLARGKQVVVVRAFVKKSQKTPKREITLAHRRKEQWSDG
jgi:phage-related protein